MSSQIRLSVCNVVVPYTQTVELFGNIFAVSTWRLLQPCMLHVASCIAVVIGVLGTWTVCVEILENQGVLGGRAS